MKVDNQASRRIVSLVTAGTSSATITVAYDRAKLSKRISGGGLVTYGRRSSVDSDLVAKLLLYSGLILCVVGAFLVLLVNVLVGAVVVGCGLFDVAMSFVIPTLRNRQS